MLLHPVPTCYLISNSLQRQTHTSCQTAQICEIMQKQCRMPGKLFIFPNTSFKFPKLLSLHCLMSLLNIWVEINLALAELEHSDNFPARNCPKSQTIPCSRHCGLISTKSVLSVQTIFPFPTVSTCCRLWHSHSALHLPKFCTYGPSSPLSLHFSLIQELSTLYI